MTRIGEGKKFRQKNPIFIELPPCDRLELPQRSSEPIIHVHFSWDSFRPGGEKLIRDVFIEGLVLTLELILTNLSHCTDCLNSPALIKSL